MKDQLSMPLLDHVSVSVRIITYWYLPAFTMQKDRYLFRYLQAFSLVI